MTNSKKIIIINKSTYDPKKKKIIGYLVEDKETKFIALNSTQRLTFHFPKVAYSYEVIDTNET